MSLLARLAGQTPKAPPELYSDSRRRRLSGARQRRADDRPAPGRHVEQRNHRRVAARRRDLVKFAALPMAPVGQKAWIQFAFAKPVAIRGVSLAIAGLKWPFGPPPPGPDLEASDDGQSFRKIANIPRSTATQNTVSFAPVRGPLLQGGVRDAAAAAAEGDRHPASAAADRAPDRGARAAHRSARDPVRGKGGVRRRSAGLSELPTPAVAPADAVKKSDVVDLTSKMASRRRRSTGRRRPATGSCCAWAIRCSASPTTPRHPRARASRWTS